MIKKRLIGLLKDSKKYVYYQVLFQWFSLLSQMIIVYNIAHIINNVFINIVGKEIFINIIIIIVMIVIKMFIEKKISEFGFYASLNVKKILRSQIYEKLLTLGPSYKEKVSTSSVVQLAVEGVEQLEIYFGKYLPQFMYSLIAPLTLFIALSFVSFKASIFLFLCVPLIPLSIVFVQKIAKRLLNKYWGIYMNLGDSFLENLEGLTTLKIYEADQHKADSMQKEATNFRNVTMKVLTMQLNSISVMDLVAYGGAVLGMAVAILEFRNGNISLASTLIIIFLASEFFIPLRLLGSFFHVAMNGMSASDRIFELLDIEKDTNKEEILESNKPDIIISDLNFAYNQERIIIKDLNISIPYGSFLGIVGKSGCGKSTLANILVGKNTNYKGKILLNKQELSNINEKSLLENIGIVTHDSYIFKGSVKDNLLMASDDEDLMWKALEEVNLADFLRSEKGLDTQLSEAGNNFSGGQRQRLALARALLKDSSIYIFDEITSNIDTDNEALIMKVIKKLSKKRTVIMISHRLVNVVDADEIIFMDQGKIIERGKHQKLMDLNGEYANLYKAQTSLENYAKEVNHE